MYPMKSAPDVSAAFIFAIILGHQFSKYAESVSVRSGMPKINRAELGEYSIALPPTKAEQDAIATALSDADALIESLEQLVTKKRQIKHGAMQELLTGKRRLSGFSGAWDIKRIEDIADVKTGPFGSSLHERDYVQDGTPIITVEHLGERGVTHSNLPRVSSKDRQRLNVYSMEMNDIVFSRVGSIDRNALIRQPEVGWLFSGRLLRVRPIKQKAFAPYLSHQFHSSPFKQRVRDVAVGQTMPCLNTRILNGIEVEVPTLAEQVAIAAILSDMDAEIAALEAKLAKARQIKQGMMQELLTGRIRLV
jgi:type I restriction enzyme S subunit